MLLTGIISPKSSWRTRSIGKKLTRPLKISYFSLAMVITKNSNCFLVIHKRILKWNGLLPSGMSISTVTAARIYKGQLKGQSGEEEQLSFDKFPYTALSRVGYNKMKLLTKPKVIIWMLKFNLQDILHWFASGRLGLLCYCLSLWCQDRYRHHRNRL